MIDILVTGGAGYIGSHVCKLLHRNGFRPIVIDNLVHGHRVAVKWGPFIEGSFGDSELLAQVFSNYRISAVMHFAAFCNVGESVQQPIKYYQNNVANGVRLLETMIQGHVKNLIFSSSCATYGEPREIPISESHPQNPINPYGSTKLMIEKMLPDFQNAYGLQHVSLRYFNAAGADPEGELGEDHHPETHLIPLVLRTAMGERALIEIFGNDYPTADGTCVRDYIHVNDLAQAHLLALKSLLDGGQSSAFNLGNGEGHSIREVIESACRITGRRIPSKMTERRAGDPAVLIASSEKAKKELGWNPSFELDAIIRTAWTWHESNPDGF